MNLEQQVCSLELAKKLKELGVKQESYFCFALQEAGEYGETIVIEEPSLVRKSGNWDEDSFVSAFTVAELGEMLPLKIKEEKIGKFNHAYLLDTRQSVGSWYIRYRDFERKLMIPTEHGTPFLDAVTESDARAKMLIYLLENKLLSI